MVEDELAAVWAVEVAAGGAGAAEQGGVAVEFPGFDGGLVQSEGVGGAGEEEQEAEEDEGVGCGEDEEVGELGDGGAEVLCT